MEKGKSKFNVPNIYNFLLKFNHIVITAGYPSADLYLNLRENHLFRKWFMNTLIRSVKFSSDERQ